MHRQRHERWKERMLSIGEDVVEDLNTMEVKAVMEKYNITEKDIALLVRFNYFTEDEVERFNLRPIEKAMPL